ncbi:MAG: cation-translocating P-type ATPase [Coleofasciculus sp. G3-WIS-01]|uniref:cation-translocating P-type ATPase n=1 Tax=Coleofasciculus sp. G3-WIS-01 TaxID=3069528 RepID=UPI0032FE67DB
MTTWYTLNLVDVLKQLNTDATIGLSHKEARQRQDIYGLNELNDRPLESPWKILWEQFSATVVVVLIVAAVISALLGEYKDAIAIFAIVVFNAILGFRQEYQAERAIAALKKLAVPTVKVRRDGILEQLSARELVPGDIVILESGNLVPADCRLLESSNLRTSEASLTGESEPIDKIAQKIATANLPLAERQNMAYMGTVISYGRALAVVTETGMKTELGQIAKAIQGIEREATPLQQRLDQLGWILAIAILILVLVIFGLGLLQGESVRLMFLMAVSLAVAAIPEGLPAVVTIALALGAQRMLKQRALIRKLPAVETLGSVTTICSDKTGTLTQNRMTVTHLDLIGHQIELAMPELDELMMPSQKDEQSKLLKEEPATALLLTAATLCNDAIAEFHLEQSNPIQVLGDPTETALIVAATRFGLWKTDIDYAFERITEVPFDAERKRMTTVHELPTTTDKRPDDLSWLKPWELLFNQASYIAFTKGAVDSLLDISTQVWFDDQITPLNDSWYEKISHANNQLAENGIRVLGIAVRPIESHLLATLPLERHEDVLEKDLIFIGMIGMIDPPRPEVKQAVLTCQKAGIRPMMITGDHPLTARYIASEVGISTNGLMLTGQDITKLSVSELTEKVDEVSVYARVSPQNKLDIVQALQNRGHIVAMTGDGINDAPALKKAEIGVAMGLTGTDVAKEAADMVLLDDNFATIVAATQEGRVIYDNVRKFIKYTLTGNCGELWVIILAPFLGMPLPLLPLQILWINLLADGLLALALGVEPAEPNIMSRPPHNPQESVFSRGVGRDIVWIGLLLGLVLLVVDYHYWFTGQAAWQTMVFSILAFSRIGLAQSMRSERESIFTLNLLSNKPLLGAVVLTFLLQLAVVYVPFLQDIFNTIGLSLSDLGISLAMSTIVIWAMELDKGLRRYKKAKS